MHRESGQGRGGRGQALWGGRVWESRGPLPTERCQPLEDPSLGWYIKVPRGSCGGLACIWGKSKTELKLCMCKSSSGYCQY